MRTRTPALLAAALLALPALAACGGNDAGSGSKVAVTATDDSCDVADTSLSAGKTTFAVTNKGSKVTEVYVYGEQGGAYTKVISEVENIGPGTSRDLSVDLAAGDYEVACKPGQQGEGIRTKIDVTGDGGGEATEKSYDREVEVEATDTSLSGLEGFTGKVGEKIEFKLENKGTVQHELLVQGPDGDELGEVHETAPGQTGEVIVTLSEAGTYTVLCPLDGHAAKGMKATFTVS